MEPAALYQRAQKLSRTGHHVEAAAAARELLAQTPDGPIARDARILICSSGAADPKALVPLAKSKVVRQDPSSIDDAEKKTSTRPLKIAGRPPRYTSRARRAGYEGKIIAEALIDTDGCVRNIKLLQGGRQDMEKLFQEALQTWVFQPATRGGRPVTVYYSLTVDFGIDRD